MHGICRDFSYRFCSQLPPLNERTVRSELNTSSTIRPTFACALSSLVASIEVIQNKNSTYTNKVDQKMCSIYTLLKMYEAPAINGITHRMIRVNFQLTMNDVIKPANMQSNVIIISLKSRPIPCSIVLMLLEKNSVISIGRCVMNIYTKIVWHQIDYVDVYRKTRYSRNEKQNQSASILNKSNLHVEEAIEREEYSCALFVVEQKSSKDRFQMRHNKTDQH